MKTEKYFVTSKIMLYYGLFYYSSKEFELEGYHDNDWTENVNNRKSTSGYVFFVGNTAFT